MSEHDISDVQFAKIFGIMIAAMVVLTIALIILAAIVGGTLDDKLTSMKAEDAASDLAARIAPLGKMTVGTTPAAQPQTAPVPAAQAAPAAVSGEDTYQSACAACHAAGVAGAPKVTDASAWTDRITQGKDTLYAHAINGYQGKAGYMPPKGGNAALSDAQVMAAVDYMLEKVQ